METVVTEDQLPGVELKLYDDVIAVLPGQRVGVEIFRARQINVLATRIEPVSTSVQRMSFIEVEDPSDLVVIDRLRTVCTDAWTRKRSN